MSYQVMGSLYSSRDQAVKALAESYLWRGNDHPDFVIEALADPAALAQDLADEWTMTISEGEDATIDEIKALYAGVVAVDRDESDLIYSEDDAISREQDGADIVRLK